MEELGRRGVEWFVYLASDCEMWSLDMGGQHGESLEFMEDFALDAGGVLVINWWQGWPGGGEVILAFDEDLACWRLRS